MIICSIILVTLLGPTGALIGILFFKLPLAVGIALAVSYLMLRESQTPKI